MLVKMFVKSGGYLTPMDRTVDELEREINAWLGANPGVRVLQVKQSATGGSLEPCKLVVSIWYDSGA
jgi:hypothetical protein